MPPKFRIHANDSEENDSNSSEEKEDEEENGLFYILFVFFLFNKIKTSDKMYFLDGGDEMDSAENFVHNKAVFSEV